MSLNLPRTLRHQTASWEACWGLLWGLAELGLETLRLASPAQSGYHCCRQIMGWGGGSLLLLCLSPAKGSHGEGSGSLQEMGLQPAPHLSFSLPIFFFKLYLWNPLCSSHLQNMWTWTSHISGTQSSSVVSDYCMGQHSSIALPIYFVTSVIYKKKYDRIVLWLWMYQL